MKQVILKSSTAIAAVMLVVGCAKLPVYESQDKTQTTAEPSRHMNGDSKMMYTVAHDSENLYLNISTSDVSTQGQILMQGLTIWLDQEGKKNEFLGFTYPLIDRQQGDREKMQERQEGQGKAGDNSTSRAQQLMKRYEEAPKQMRLLGFEAPESVQMVNPTLETAPIDVTIDFNDFGVLEYKARIPLHFVFTDSESDHSNLSVGVFAEAPELPQRPSGDQGGGRGQGGPPPGGGGGGGGGRPGGGGGPGGGPGQGGGMSTPEAIQFWFAVHLNNTVQ